MSAPHLPPKTCSLPLRGRLRALPFFFFIVFVSCLTGATAALLVVAWFQPAVGEGSALTRYIQQDNDTTPEPYVLGQVKQRMLSVYDASAINEDGLYVFDEPVAHAVLLSSDGWSAVPLVADSPRSLSSLHAIDAQGISYEPVSFFDDPVAGVRYIKWDGNGFRVVSFVRDVVFADDHALWFFDRGLSATTLEAVSTPVASRALFDQATGYRVQHAADGSGIGPLFTVDGSFAGFVSDEQQFVPSFLLEHQLSSILSDTAPAYRTLPVRGYFVYAKETESGTAPFSGFYVEQSSLPAVERGDVIVRLDGAVVRPETLLSQLLQASETVTLRLIRDDEQIDVQVDQVAL